MGVLELSCHQLCNMHWNFVNITKNQGGTKLFAVSDRKLSMIPDSRVLESNKSKKLAAIEILRTF